MFRVFSAGVAFISIIVLLAGPGYCSSSSPEQALNDHSSALSVATEFSVVAAFALSKTEHLVWNFISKVSFSHFMLFLITLLLCSFTVPSAEVKVILIGSSTSRRW